VITAEAVKEGLDFEAFYRQELGELKPGSNGNAKTTCPFHSDKEPSLSVNLTNGCFHCFGCGAEGDVIDFAMKKWGFDFKEALAELAQFAGLDPDVEDRRGENEGLSLEAFATAKKLPLEFLARHGVKQAKGKRPYLVIEYRGLDGKPIPEATRMRFSMAERPKAKRGGKPALYGLWRQAELLAEDGELLLLEGESDTLTAWLHNLPAVGVPGKTLLKALDPEFFKDFRKVFVWEEPDAQGWAQEVAARLKDLPGLRVFAMIPPPGLKDISDAHCQGLDVLATVRAMQAQAVEVSGSQNNNDKNHQQNQTFTGKGEEKSQENQENSDGGRGASAKARVFIINYCKNLAKNGIDPSFCRKVIEFIENSGEKRSITGEVREWVLTTSGYFLTTDCYRDLELTTRDYKKAAVIALLRLEAEGLIEKCGQKRGCYRRVERDCEPIDFMNAPDGPPLPLRWPLSLETLVKLYPKNVAVVAGSKDAGKTAFCLNFARLNQDLFETHYFCSEIAAQEFRERLKLFKEPLDFWKIKVWERSSNFADVIKPDALNIIDFFEISNEFYLISKELKAIHDKLNKGVALIAIQKDKNAKLGRGGSFSIEKARLYVTLDAKDYHNELTIVSGKNWAQKDKNPAGVVIKFKLINGAKFVEVE
jgi:hypothetical protein